MRDPSRQAAGTNRLNDDEDYPLSYFLYVVGAVLALVVGAVLYLYISITR
jgi:hypothetical protein